MIHLYNFINSNLFALIFLVLCGGGIVGVFIISLWDWWKEEESLFDDVNFLEGDGKN
jgi:hypothetical protein